MLIVVLAAGLLTQLFPCCAFAIRSFSKVSATPVALVKALISDLHFSAQIFHAFLEQCIFVGILNLPSHFIIIMIIMMLHGAIHNLLAAQ